VLCFVNTKQFAKSLYTLVYYADNNQYAQAVGLILKRGDVMLKAVGLLMFTSLLFSANINIAVAANVSYVIEELKAEFVKTHPGTNVIIILGSSGKLTAQIKNGAPYGLFLSADMKYPQALFNEKIAITEPRVYAKGSLAYLSAKERDFSSGMALLKDENVLKIAVANPKTAPYGKASVEAMQNAAIYAEVKNKLVYAESISQTVSYSLTAADIGLIAKSTLYSAQMRQYKENVHWKDVDAKLYTPIKQGIVLLKQSQSNKEYQAFYEFILSDEAKAIFRKYGYMI
jgi:molybdate transport system substrate-binding protein